MTVAHAVPQFDSMYSSELGILVDFTQLAVNSGVCAAWCKPPPPHPLPLNKYSRMELTWIEAAAVPPGPRVQYSPVRNHCSGLPHSDLAALAQSSRPKSPILRFVQRGPAHSAAVPVVEPDQGGKEKKKTPQKQQLALVNNCLDLHIVHLD